MLGRGHRVDRARHDEEPLDPAAAYPAPSAATAVFMPPDAGRLKLAGWVMHTQASVPRPHERAARVGWMSGVGALVDDGAMAGWACEFDAELWEWSSSPEGTSWVFVTVPPEETEEIRLRSGPPRGFGSVRVEVTLGGSTWRTSVFPDKERGYVLPVKRAVRRAESLEVGDPARLRLELV